MKKRFFNGCSYAALAAVLTLAVAQVSVRAQGEQKAKSQAGQLEGTWDARITIVNCTTGVPPTDPPTVFQGLGTYVRGGSLIETGSGTYLRTPGHGVWEHDGAQRFAATLKFFRFNAAGAFVGSTVATKTIELGEDKNEYTATASIAFFNTDGSPVLLPDGSPLRSCATETARRFGQ